VSERDYRQSLQKKRDFWKQQVLDWQESKLSQVEYCRRHTLSKTRFSYWCRRFRSGPVQVPWFNVLTRTRSSKNWYTVSWPR